MLRHVTRKPRKDEQRKSTSKEKKIVVDGSCIPKKIMEKS